MERSALTVLLDRLGQTRASGLIGRDDFSGTVVGLSAALVHLGLSAGARVAVLAADGTESLEAGLAVLLAGGALVPLDPALSEEALRTALESTEATHAVAADERQLARLLAIRPDLPRLELLIVMAVAPSDRKPAALTAASAIALGREQLAERPGLLREAIAANATGEACLLVDSGGRVTRLTTIALSRAALRLAEAIGGSAERLVVTTLRPTSYEGLAHAIGALGRGTTLLVEAADASPAAEHEKAPVEGLALSDASLRRMFQFWQESLGARNAIVRVWTSWALQQGRSRHTPPWKRRLAESFVLKRLRRRMAGRAVSVDVVTAVRRDLPTDIKSFFESVGLPVKTHRLDGESPLAR